MLELRRVTKRFSGIPAVDDVSFCARPGEVTGYLGPDGSGKSTTMKIGQTAIAPFSFRSLARSRQHRLPRGPEPRNSAVLGSRLNRLRKSAQF